MRRLVLALLIGAALALTDDADVNDPTDDRVTPRVLAPLGAGGLEAVADRPGATLLALHAGPCPAALDALNEMIANWGTLLTAASVDVAADAAAAKELGVRASDLPSCALRLVGAPAGDDKPDPDEWPVWTGAADDGRGLQKFAFTLFPAAAVPVSTPAALAALAAAPDGAAPRAVGLLFSEGGATPPPLLNALAWHLKDVGYVFGSVPSNDAADLIAHFKVGPKFPTFALAFTPPADMRAKLEAAGGEGKGTPAGGGLAVQPFGGPLRFVLLHAWLRVAAPQIGLVKGGAGGAAGSGASSRGLADPAAPPVAVPRLAAQTDLAALCPPSRRALCVLASLDDTSAAGKTALTELASVAGAWAHQPVAFGYVDAATHGAALAAAGAHGVSPATPTALVYSPAKGRGVPLQAGEPLTAASLGALLEAVFAGAARTHAIETLPDLDAAAAGSGAAAEGVEDEFSLDDVLKEEVAAAKPRRARGDREEL
jgi:hypothetical protein